MSGRGTRTQKRAEKTALRVLWSTPILLTAFAGSAVLDYLEWVEHHPPEIAIIIVLHFVFVWAALAVIVYVWQRFYGQDRRSA